MADSPPESQHKLSNPADSVVLEEEIDPNYVPTDQEVDEYAKWLGINMEEDKELLWIAREGLMAPLPKNWKPCKTKDTDDIYYFNFDTGESTWDHPCDGYYKRIYEEEKKKLETQKSKSSDLVRSRAKQDVDTLLGKTESKKKKSKESDKTLLSPPKKLLSVPSIGLKAIKSAPLPDIRKSSDFEDRSDNALSSESIKPSKKLVTHRKEMDNEDRGKLDGTKMIKKSLNFDEDDDSDRPIVLSRSAGVEVMRFDDVSSSGSDSDRPVAAHRRAKKSKSKLSSSVAEEKKDSADPLASRSSNVFRSSTFGSVEASDDVIAVDEDWSRAVREEKSDTESRSVMESRPKRKQEDELQRDERTRRDAHLRLMSDLGLEWDEEVRLHQTNVRKQRSEMMRDIEAMELEHDERVKHLEEKRRKLEQSSALLESSLPVKSASDKEWAAKLASAEQEIESLAQRLRSAIESSAAAEAALKKSEDELVAARESEEARLSLVAQLATTKEKYELLLADTTIAHAAEAAGQSAAPERELQLKTDELLAAQSFLKETQATVEVLSAEKSVVVNELQTVRLQLESITESRNRLRAEVDAVQSENRQLRVEKESADEKLIQLGKRIEALSSPSPESSLLELCKADLASTQAELEKEKMESRNSMHALSMQTEVLGNLEIEVSSLKEALREREAAMVLAEERWTNSSLVVESALKETTAENLQLKKTIESKREALVDLDDRLRLLQASNAEKVSRIESLVSGERSHVASLNAVTHSKDEVISKLGRDIKHLEQLQANMEASALTRGVGDATVKGADEQVTKLLERVSTLTSEMLNTETVNSELVATNAALNTLRESLEQRIVALEVELGGQTEDRDQLLRLGDAKVAQKDLEIRSLRERVAALEADLLELQSAYADSSALSNQYVELKRVVARMQEDAIIKELAISANQSSLDEHKLQEEILSKRADQLKKSSNENAHALANTKAELESSLEGNRLLRSRLDQISQDLEASRLQLKSAVQSSKDQPEVSDRIEKLQAELMAEKSKARSLEQLLESTKFELGQQIAAMASKISLHEAAKTLPSSSLSAIPESLLTVLRSQEAKLNELLSNRAGVEKAFDDQRDLVLNLGSKISIQSSRVGTSSSAKPSDFEGVLNAMPASITASKTLDDDIVRKEMAFEEPPKAAGIATEEESQETVLGRVLKVYTAGLADKGKSKVSKMSGVKKMVKEKMLIDSAKEELGKEAGKIGDKQIRLQRAKDQWKQENASKSSSHRARTALRERSAEINHKAAALNSRIDAAKRLQKWITDREQKLRSLERTLLEDDSQDGEQSPFERISRELDDDISVLEVSSNPSSTPSQYSEKQYWQRPSSHRKYRHSEHQYAAPDDGHDRQGFYVHPPAYPPAYTPPEYHPRFYFDAASHGYFNGMPPPPPPAMYFSDEISDSLAAYSRSMHGPVRKAHWSAPLQPPAYDSRYPERGLAFAKPLPSGAENKRELKEITNRLASSKEACDNHSNWLESMRKEVSTFDKNLRSSMQTLQLS